MIWVVLVCILTALFLLSLTRIGVRAEYNGQQFIISLRLGPAALRVYPLKQKKPKKKKPVKSNPQKKQETPTPAADGKLSLLWDLLPVALHAAGNLKRKICVDILEVYVLLASGGDPASVAIAYGSSNAVIGMVLPILEQNLHIRQREIRIEADFQKFHSEVQAKVALSLTLGQAVAFALHFGWQALGVVIRWRRQQSELEKINQYASERAVPYGKEPSHQ